VKVDAEADGDAPDDVRRGYRVHGRVQGVGFRWWTARAANRTGVRGTVRNVADGTVEVMAVGSEGALEEFEVSLRKGPPFSVVERIEAVTCRLPAQVTDFSIER
jgi:acylphosphatase